jgi:hypothetical protein
MEIDGNQKMKALDTSKRRWKTVELTPKSGGCPWKSEMHTVEYHWKTLEGRGTTAAGQ